MMPVSWLCMLCRKAETQPSALRPVPSVSVRFRRAPLTMWLRGTDPFYARCGMLLLFGALAR